VIIVGVGTNREINRSSIGILDADARIDSLYGAALGYGFRTFESALGLTGPYAYLSAKTSLEYIQQTHH
jgi:hypothetical protein